MMFEQIMFWINEFSCLEITLFKYCWKFLGLVWYCCRSSWVSDIYKREIKLKIALFFVLFFLKGRILLLNLAKKIISFLWIVISLTHLICMFLFIYAKWICLIDFVILFKSYIVLHYLLRWMKLVWSWGQTLF